MKIALVNSEYPSNTGSGQGGIATYTYTMAQALCAQGHIVYVLVRKGIKPTQIPNGINAIFYEYTSDRSLTKRLKNRFLPGFLKWEKGHTLCLRNKLLEIHKKGNLDIAEFPEYGGTAFHCTPPVPFPVIVNFHMPTFFVDQLNNRIPDKLRIKQYKFEEAAINNATAYRCPSNAMKKEICTHYGIHPDKIIVIPNPVSITPFESISKNKKKDFHFHILFTGRLERRKGAELLQKVIKEILEIDNSINITIAGETEMNDAFGYRQVIERTLNQQQRQRIWFLGSIHRQELLILYHRSSILLAPSLFENSPYSILEAMAAQLPVIASSSGGIPEIITHNETGLLFNINDPSSMVKHIKLVFEKPQLGTELAKKAYNNIKKSFSPQVISEKTLSFYKSVIHI